MNIANSSPIVQKYLEIGLSKSCPIIDMHGHMGPFVGAYLPSVPVKKMKASLSRAGVKQIICTHHEALFGDPDNGNAMMQAAIDKNPGLFLGYWMVNPNLNEQLEHTIENFEKARGFVGFKFLPDYHAYPLSGKSYTPALEYANEYRLLVLVHTWGGSPFDSPQALAEIARKYPKATFLMGHSGYGDFDTSVKIAHEFPNVYLELTAVYVAHDFAMFPAGSGTPSPLGSCLQVNGIIEYMVQHASSKKIVFGTDMPWYSPHFAAGAVLFSRISDRDRHNILHVNAEGLLGKIGL